MTNMFTRLFILIVLFTLLVAPATSQLAVKGKVKSIQIEWIYFMQGGKNVPETKTLVTLMEFDEQGRVVRHSEFGNGEERITYVYSDGRTASTITYFDDAGNERSDYSSKFLPVTVIPVNDGLCTEYSIRIENIETYKEVREYELCSGTNVERATTIREYGANGKLIRSLRKDVRERTSEKLFDYGKDGELMTFRHFIDDRVRPKNWHRQEYVDWRYDETGNLSSYIATNFQSTSPNQISSQWKEVRTILYY